ncbi:MAG: hypothetical protein Q4E16_03365 [Neisseria sp.]|nr:hypothetical protein [Neisseria sp.]
MVKNRQKNTREIHGIFVLSGGQRESNWLIILLILIENIFVKFHDAVNNTVTENALNVQAVLVFFYDIKKLCRLYLGKPPF